MDSYSTLKPTPPHSARNASVTSSDRTILATGVVCSSSFCAVVTPSSVNARMNFSLNSSVPELHAMGFLGKAGSALSVAYEKRARSAAAEYTASGEPEVDITSRRCRKH